MILPETELHSAPSRPTSAVDILAFVEAQEIPTDYFETPYYLSPAPGGEKAYALLRETLRRTRKIGIAYVVIRARKQLAALVPEGQSLVLNTLRWTSEAGEAKYFGMQEEDMLAARELAMMSPRWNDADTGGWDLAWHRKPYEHDYNALAQHTVKLDQSAAIVVDELDQTIDDEDDLDTDDYLAYTLRRKPHAVNGYAKRRHRRPHWHAHRI